MARELISTGNELAARAAIDGRLWVFGGYPITPSSEIMHVFLLHFLKLKDITSIQMEDEIVGICTALVLRYVWKKDQWQHQKVLEFL